MRLVSLALVTGAMTVAVACGHESSTCIDDMGIVVTQFTTDGYNMVVRTSGGGSGLNLSWSCPQGGSATITGTADTANINYDLTWTFTACHDTTIEDLTFSGVLHDQVQNGTSSSGKTETAHSDAFTMMGHNTVCNADPINATCVVDITPSKTTICGLTN
jgi:hypothetical protein